MRRTNCVGLSLALSIALSGAALATESTTPPKAPAVNAVTAVAARTPIDVDCQKVGGEVSALIDREKTSGNISAARAIFQRGIMDCMEGDQEEANRLYQEAKHLLNAEEPKIRVPLARQ